MFPTLVKIGPIGLHSYGLMLAAAFMLGIWLMQRGAARMGVAREHIADLGLWILAAAVVGSRLFYVATHWAEFSARPLSLLAVWDGGLTFYGGVLAALPVSWLYVRSKKLPYWELSDLAAPAFALGVGLGRIGCFLSGCCFGLPSNLPWAVRFPPHSFAGQVYGCPLHPTQLYESAFGFACFGLLWVLSKKKHFPGFLMCLFLGLYGAWRLLVDLWRHYETTQVWALGLTNNQWVSIIMVAGAAALGVYLSRRRRAKERREAG
jgi:phosphatidylglycerol:prolipoprotein diacylglycerol transferase